MIAAERASDPLKGRPDLALVTPCLRRPEYEGIDDRRLFDRSGKTAGGADGVTAAQENRGGRALPVMNAGRALATCPTPTEPDVNDETTAPAAKTSGGASTRQRILEAANELFCNTASARRAPAASSSTSASLG